MQIFQATGPLSVIGHQPVVSQPKRTVGKQLLPMHITRKGSGFAQQVGDDVPIINHRAAISGGPR